MLDQTRYFDVLGHRVYVTRQAKANTAVRLPLLLLAVGLLVTAFHEFTYRQTGGDDFPLLHIVSHAGGDMLMLLGVLVFVAVFCRRVAERGVR